MALAILHLVFGIAELHEHWHHFAVHALSAVVVLMLCAATWLWPRLGGALLTAVGVYAFWHFHHPFAYAFVAAPAIILGLVGVCFRGFYRPRAQG